jgi:hypothetical protein
MIGATATISVRIVGLLAFILLAGIPREVRSQSDERIEDAKKEGQLVFYSGMIVQDTQIVLTAFEKRYPFIKTTHYRARGSALVGLFWQI